jgi:hypothetical protein
MRREGITFAEVERICRTGMLELDECDAVTFWLCLATVGLVLNVTERLGTAWLRVMPHGPAPSK